MFTFLSLTTAICLLACTSNSQNNIAAKAACDGPDAPVSCSFLEIPKDVTHVMKMNTTSGTPMIIKGMVTIGGKPARDIVIYAYHTDEKGLYSKAGNETGVQKWHGRHHGWAITNANGEYELHTIRPGKYPNSNAPAHIHAAVLQNGEAFWVSDFVFKDDPNVGDNYRTNYPGGRGVVDLKIEDGMWKGIRNIVL
jgi:protocatechuate 3,4-dioxygenase beta subunit